MCHHRGTSALPRQKAECAGSVRSTVRLSPSLLGPIEEVPEEAEYMRNVQALAADKSQGSAASLVAAADMMQKRRTNSRFRCCGFQSVHCRDDKRQRSHGDHFNNIDLEAGEDFYI